ncbi:hypothetical protein SAY87_010308 [Trapa incisa]|uniref:UBL3-like ubiquitin domain-containing protein n=1 Tax=Trapa incisa TaxID=236973 RepID=A0AAN7GED8_9MYRT|nr:hypothetical protein SAY87_010308 [Trapa incisa]
MASRAVQDQLKIKFRLADGSDIGPKLFPMATSVTALKESVLAELPKGNDDGPKTTKDVKLICSGRILKNHQTVADCQSRLCGVPGGATTMHVIIRPASARGMDFF